MIRLLHVMAMMDHPAMGLPGLEAGLVMLSDHGPDADPAPAEDRDTALTVAPNPGSFPH